MQIKKVKNTIFIDEEQAKTLPCFIRIEKRSGWIFITDRKFSEKVYKIYTVAGVDNLFQSNSFTDLSNKLDKLKVEHYTKRRR